jgi:hypothetical protein
MPDDLHDRDVLLWAERQAELLSRLAAGERVNADVDWPNVIEEIHDAGLSELHGCESLLLQGLAHLLKLHAWPDAAATAHWRGETVGFLDGARRYFAPSMRQRIDLQDLHKAALRRVRAGADTKPSRQLPETCPYTLDELLEETSDVMELVAKLSV